MEVSSFAVNTAAMLLQTKNTMDSNKSMLLFLLYNAKTRICSVTRNVRIGVNHSKKISQTFDNDQES